MIPETQQDLAIAYLLGDLDPASAARFETEMQANAELGQFVDELRESTATLALVLPAQIPPPALRARILAGLRLPAAAADPPRARIIPGPWWAGLAACLAFALGYAVMENRAANARLEAERARETLLAGSIAALSQELVQLRVASAAQLKQIADLSARDSLARVKIATLSAQVDTYQRAGVVVIWDDVRQQGLAKLVNLPKPAAGRDYQLWIVDPKYPSPVNGGILTVTDEAGTVASFKPDQVITSADAFAISVEKTGGVPKAEGPIVFIGK